MEKTERGFAYDTFFDDNGKECTIQISSIYAEEEHIWLGAKHLELKKFDADNGGWHDVELEDTMKVHYVANKRMHLSQSTVKKLLPILQRFAETGKLEDDLE